MQSFTANQIESGNAIAKLSKMTIQSKSSETTIQSHLTSNTSSYVPKQLSLKPFDLDPDDSYHFLLAELSPTDLQDIPEADLGDINHPAAVRCNSAHSLFAVSDVKALVNNSPPVGPLYTLTKVRVCGDMSFPPGFSVND